MKLVLISPKGPLYRHRGGIFKQNLRYAPLTLTTLASLIPPELHIDIEEDVYAPLLKSVAWKKGK